MTPGANYWIVHLHGDHGFVSDGLRYSDHAEAKEYAERALAQNPYLRGAEIIHSSASVEKIMREDKEIAR